MSLEDLCFVFPFSSPYYHCPYYHYLNYASYLFCFGFCVECWQAWVLVNEANLGDLLNLKNGMCISIVFIWYVDLICLVLLTRSLFPFTEINKIDLRSLLALQGKKRNC